MSLHPRTLSKPLAAETKVVSLLFRYLVKWIMSWKKAHLSIDLVEAALEHRQFLQLVDNHPSLYAGPHIQNAIRRYLQWFCKWCLFNHCTCLMSAYAGKFCCDQAAILNRMTACDPSLRWISEPLVCHSYGITGDQTKQFKSLINLACGDFQF